MAIFSASVRSISRAAGQSAVAAAAYRSGTVVRDTRSGKTHDYTRKGGVMRSFIVLPKGALEALRERSVLWNAAEAVETRKNARVARELLLALPHELEEEVREAVARSMAVWLCERYGVVVDASLHEPDRGGDRRNFHAHLLFTTREVGAEGFGAKTRVLDHLTDGPLEVLAIRQAWEERANRALAAAGLGVRIDHRSHQDLGILLPPQIHVGQKATAMARRGAKPPSSVIRVEFRGREVNYPAIDHGVSRAEYNAEIISLQKYRDVQLERQDRENANLTEEQTIEDQIEALQEQASEVIGDIAGIETALSGAVLSGVMRGRIRAILDRVMATLFWRHQHEAELQQQRFELQQKTRELEEKKKEHQSLQRKVEELNRKLEESRAVIVANRALYSKVERMPSSFNSTPPSVIRMHVPLRAVFEYASCKEASYRVSLRKQDLPELLQRVFKPPGAASRSSLSIVTLRQDVLQVKELLSRIDLKKRAGVQSLFPSVPTSRIPMRS